MKNNNALLSPTVRTSDNVFDPGASAVNVCPSDWKACDSKCKTDGRIGGYCGGLWSARCTCVRRKVSITSDVIPFIM
ncbi:hypothetical protein CEXT_77491 [Caerostris extrusa]|uniref:Invertebrate defensins family profile domain-containing protein n=1 Tax=Caerostris extrusa TaxID=172846 RepID=A0AAV4Y7F1_CAEEX|nr:hypothetical protein CEXT_77491 [Caerostris extrusa]